MLRKRQRPSTPTQTGSPPHSSPSCAQKWRAVTDRLQVLALKNPQAAAAFVAGSAKALEILIADGGLFP